MAWYDDEDSYDFGGAFDVAVDDGFDLGGFDLGNIDPGVFDVDFGNIDFGGFDLGSIPSDVFDFDLGSIDFGPDLGSIPSDVFDFDLGSVNFDPGIFQGIQDFGSNIYQNVADFGSNLYGDITNLFGGTDYADIEDRDAGRYLDEQYAADILEGIDQSDADAELFRQQAILADQRDAMDIADIQDRDAALYLDELYGQDTAGFSAADQSDLDAEMYRQELLDQQTANRDVLEDIMSMADQEDIDREMYRQEQEDLGITREGAASGKFTDLSGGKGTTNITKEELTKKTDDKKTDDTKKDTGGGKITDILKDKDNQALLMLLGGLLGLLGNKGGGGGAPGYKGGIPTYTATRGTPTSPTAGGRRAGGAGLGSLTGGVTYTKAAQGGLMDVMAGQPNESVLMMARGGETGRYLRGGTDGMADKIYTNIDGQQPARLSHGEFVIPADVVSHLGNGNSDAGAKELHDMMNRVRKARTGTTKQGKEIKPRKHMAA